MNEISMRDRYRGAMVGTLCGDALGAAYEWMPEHEVREDIKARGGLVPHEYVPFDYIEPWKKKRVVLKGHPTDDSELAAALAESLIAHPELDRVDLYNRLRSFIHGRKSILTDTAYGSGSTLSASLRPETYEESIAKFGAGEMPMPPSNGSLMRCAPIALTAVNAQKSRLMTMAFNQSGVTHRNPACVAACMLYSLVMRAVLHGRITPREGWGFYTVDFLSESYTSSVFSLMPEVIKKMQTFYYLSIDEKPDYETEIKGKEGWVVLSLRVAAWAAATSTSFADGIIKSISVGGDTDTYGAIAGGILGAYYGIGGIPQEWLEVLQGREKMIELADQLYDNAVE
jgi:ADP-ribosyl-[dinitrogen reductase] hydrolase